MKKTDYLKKFTILDWSFIAVFAYVLLNKSSAVFNKTSYFRQMASISDELSEKVPSSIMFLEETLLPYLMLALCFFLFTLILPVFKFSIRFRRWGIFAVAMLTVTSNLWFENYINNFNFTHDILKHQKVQKHTDKLKDFKNKEEKLNKDDCDYSNIYDFEVGGLNIIKLNSKDLKKYIPNIDKTFRAVPNYKCSKKFGFKVFAIEKDSFLNVIGLKNSDVIVELNSQEPNIDSVNAFFDNIKSSQKSELKYFYDNKIFTVVIEFI